MHALRRHAVLIAIFVLALSLRSYHLSNYPRPNETADEYAWTWAGLTMVTSGVPRSWSWLPPYANVEMKHWRGNEYRLVTPWLDHPPLFPLTMGTWMRSFGYKDPFWVDLWTMRVASLVLFAVTFWLLGGVLTRMGDRRTTVLTLLTYALCPLAVFNGRLVVAENLFLAIYLAMLLVLRGERDRGWARSGLALGAVALPLAKVAAVALSLHLAMVAWLRQRRAAAVIIVVGTLVGASAFWFYGVHYDSKLFHAILHAQGARFTGFHAFFELLFVPKVVEERVPCLLLVLGLSVLIGELKEEGSFEWLLLIVLYAGLIAFFADAAMVRGWYLLPLLPALSYGVARQILRMWDEAGARSKWIWIAFTSPDIADRVMNGHADRLAWVRYSYLATVLVGAALLLWLPRGCRPAAKGVTIALVTAQAVSDVALILSR